MDQPSTAPRVAPELVEADLDEVLAGGLPASAAGLAGGSVVAIWMLGEFGEIAGWWWIWLLWMQGSAVVHAVLAWRGRRRELRDRAWRRQVYIASVAQAGSWPALLWLGSAGDDLVTQLAVLVLVLAISAGVTRSYASTRWLARACLLVLWVPIAVYLGVAGQPMLVAGSAVFVGVLTEYHRGSHRILLEAVRLRHVAQELADDLAEREAAARTAATTDRLTGLLNRAGLLDHLATVGHGTTVALLFIDLDMFKRVNDALGHAGGDRLLSEIGQRLTGLTPGATVSRLGGDEFVVAIRPAPGVADLDRLAHDALERVERPIEIGDDTIAVSASIGVATGSAPLDPVELLEAADIAMYGAKDDGRRRVVHFDASLQLAAAERNAMRTELGHALDTGDIEPWGQPIVATTTLETVAVEVLSRWYRTGHGLTMPDRWVPEVEDLGRIADLGRLCLDAAAGFAARVSPDIDVWVNIGAHHLLGGRLVDDIRTSCERHGVAPHRLVVELTESVLVDDLDRAQACLEELASTGVRVALDDFGSGYSSLAMLARLPVSIIKLDRGFVRGLEHDPRRQATVAAVVAIAERLELEVVAEGVETPTERDLAALLGVPLAQGFLFARPSSLDGLVAGLRAQPHRLAS